jgi:hypothetical protein
MALHNQDKLVIALAREKLGKLDAAEVLESHSGLAIISLLGHVVENGAKGSSRRARVLQQSPWFVVGAGAMAGLVKLFG